MPHPAGDRHAMSLWISAVAPAQRYAIRTAGAFRQFPYPTSPLSVLPQVRKNVAGATTKLVPLQRTTEVEEARQAAKKADAKARAKKKAKRTKPKK